MEADQFDFSVEHQRDERRGQRRRAVRVRLPGMAVWILERDTCFPLVDLNTLGLAFKDEAQSFQPGQAVQVDVHVQGKVWVAGLEAQILGIRDGFLVACTFPNMTKFQELRMDKLILEIQKRSNNIHNQQPKRDEDEADSSQT